jgi:hypothetical protein
LAWRKFRNQDAPEGQAGIKGNPPAFPACGLPTAVSRACLSFIPMTSPETIVCKPTPWFLLRAVVMLLMFGVFSVLFYKDGSTGYRKKNESFYLAKTFEMANSEFAKKNADGQLTAQEWKSYAAKQVVDFPPDKSVLPESLQLPMPWPPVLQDYERMKTLQWNILWQEYSREKMMNSHVEHPYEAKEIKEQWIVFVICSVLTVVAAFFLLRTLGRSISADSEAVTTQRGKRIPYADLKKLDLRKWETKGLAFIDYDGPSGKGRIRIDGLTYGGFKKENDEPAERLMKRIRTHFSGEITEYATVSASAPVDDESTSA